MLLLLLLLLLLLELLHLLLHLLLLLVLVDLACQAAHHSATADGAIEHAPIAAEGGEVVGAEGTVADSLRMTTGLLLLGGLEG